MLSPFEYAKSINVTKKYIFGNDDEKYTQFMVNRAMSYQYDCVAAAQIANQFVDITDKMHYDFLFYEIAPKKDRKYIKWEKALKLEDVQLIQQVYFCNQKTALQYLSLLNKEGLQKLKDSLFRGGSDVKS
jgi:hypothetical protein